MAVCVVSLKFANLVAKWPGVSHDAFEWTYFTVCDIFLNSDTRVFTLRQCITLEKIFVDLLSWTQVTPLKKRLTRPMPGQKKTVGVLKMWLFFWSYGLSNSYPLTGHNWVIWTPCIRCFFFLFTHKWRGGSHYINI